MEKDMALGQRLREAGATDELIARYQRYLDSGDRQGQERLLRRCRRMQSEALKKNREKLVCLDYIIARVEKTQNLVEDRDYDG